MLDVIDAVGVAVGDDDGSVVQQAGEDADGGDLLGPYRPLCSKSQWDPLAGEGRSSASGDRATQQLGSGMAERGQSEFVKDEQVHAQ